MDFCTKYGPWALVAGGSDGIGLAFSKDLARRGLNIVIAARRKELLLAAQREITEKYPVEVKIITSDLADPASRNMLLRQTDDLVIGLLVYNAAMSPVGPFLETPSEKLAAAVQTNCAGPVDLAHHYGRLMASRGNGGIILMSSMTAFQGTPLVATYGATKSFNLILAEGIGYELSASGIDVLACCAGPTLTANYINSKPDPSKRPGTTEMLPEDVVTETLAAIGSRNVLIPGRLNRFYSMLMSKLLSRHQSVSLIGKNMYAIWGLPRKNIPSNYN